jgi:hypothetical protein
MYSDLFLDWRMWGMKRMEGEGEEKDCREEKKKKDGIGKRRR